MALLLDRTLRSGVVTSYHRVLRANFNFNPAQVYQDDGVAVLVELEIGEYLTEEARRSGLAPVRSEVMTIPASELTKTILADIYLFLGQPPSEGVAVFGYEGAVAV